LRFTHVFLEGLLASSHDAAKKHLQEISEWPTRRSAQSEWTLWAHYTFAAAIRGIYRLEDTAKMSLRVSTTTKHKDFWGSAKDAGIVGDHTTQQQGVDFCLMGPTGNRYKYLTGESECDPGKSVSISLSEKGYIWDWSKLLGFDSEHRLLFAVVSGTNRRLDLRKNMESYFQQTFSGGISKPEGIGGYILARNHANREDSYCFVVRQGQISFKKISRAPLL